MTDDERRLLLLCAKGLYIASIPMPVDKHTLQGNSADLAYELICKLDPSFRAQVPSPVDAVEVMLKGQRPDE